MRTRCKAQFLRHCKATITHEPPTFALIVQIWSDRTGRITRAHLAGSTGNASAGQRHYQRSLDGACFAGTSARWNADANCFATHCAALASGFRKVILVINTKRYLQLLLLQFLCWGSVFVSPPGFAADSDGSTAPVDSNPVPDSEVFQRRRHRCRSTSSPRPKSQNVTINLINRLVERGVLSAEDARELIQQAENDAAEARAQAPQPGNRPGNQRYGERSLCSRDCQGCRSGMKSRTMY